MNKTILTIVLSVFVIGMFSLVLAADKTDLAKGAKPELTGAEAKNMTFGQCVSDAAILKNACYDTVKTTKEICKLNAKNQTESRIATKACNSDYKNEMKQCKTDFKSGKQECKKIKHNFFESAKAAFK